VRQSEAPETSGEAIEDAEEKAGFLNREVQYSQQLFSVLKGIQHVGQMLNDVEKASHERRILDSLRLLESNNTSSTRNVVSMLINTRDLGGTGRTGSEQVMPGDKTPRHTVIRAQVTSTCCLRSCLERNGPGGHGD
jgi:hypothetical protein